LAEVNAGPAASSYPRPLYAWYVVCLLTIIYIVGYIDRYILSLLIEPIKETLYLNDFQIGLLIGPAFVVFYVTLGVPIGWLADRKSRRIIVTVGITLWSLMTAACGITKSFITLFAARIGVGIGEATIAPCSASLIGDTFPVGTRPRAMAFWISAAPLGAGSTYLIGGQVVEMINAAPPLVLPLLGELYSWQTAFLVVAMPGLFLAALFYITVPEPIRRDGFGSTKFTDGNLAENPSVRDTARYFGSRWKAYLAVCFGAWGTTLVGAASFWTPALFLRTWGWDVGTSGLAIGVVLIVNGILVTNLSGWLAARWTLAGIAHGPYRCVFAGGVIVLPFLTIFPLMPTPELGVLMFFFGFIGMSMTTAVTTTAVIAITPSRLRGQATALLFLVINLFGALVGPPMVGLITDIIGDPNALKYGWSITCGVTSLIMCFGLWWGLKHYRAEAGRQAG